MHVHDTRGMGLANCLKAIEMGIYRFDRLPEAWEAVPLRQAPPAIRHRRLVNMLHEMNVSTGIDFYKLLAAVRLIGET